ncbi:MAG: 4Fe-4S binding protein [Candidatus Helarchaeota archaeon]
MVQESILGKRNLLYEMLLKLSGIEKRVTLSIEELESELSVIQEIFSPYLTALPTFLEKLMTVMYHYLIENIGLEKIRDKKILDYACQAFEEVTFEQEELNRAKEVLLKALYNQRQFLEGTQIVVEEEKEDLDQLIQFLLIAFNRLDKKLDKFLTKTPVSQDREFKKIIKETRDVIDLISMAEFAEDQVQEVISRIKNLNIKLKYKDASFTFALIVRGFKAGRISLQKFQTLLKTKVRVELIRAILIRTLEIYGSQTLAQIEEKTEISSKQLFKNCIMLLDRKEIIINELDHELQYDVPREYPKLHRFISKETLKLKKNRAKLPVLSQSLLAAILSTANAILEKLSKIGELADKIYQEEKENLKQLLNRFNKATGSKGQVQKVIAQKERIAALIESYNMFRLKMVHEKEPYLIEGFEREAKEKKLDNFISTIMKIDYERGLLISILKASGPLSIIDLTRLSGLPPNKVVRHILKMTRDKHLIIKGTENNYFLYDVLRSLSKFEKKFLEAYYPLINSMKAYLNFARFESIKLDDLTKLASNLQKFIDSLSKLITLEQSDEIQLEIQVQVRQTNEILNLCKKLNEKLPKSRSRFDLTKSAMMPLPRIEGEYEDLIEPHYLVGFGEIEWDINKCLACASCREICPEKAIELVNEWDLPATFKMTEQDMEILPENRRKLILLIRNLAVKKPSKIIKLPKETLGFGKIQYNPLSCIACRKCEERCPNNALTFHEFWNFPEIMKTLMEEK